MSIISKICIFVLMWMVIGAISIIGMYAIGAIRIYKLNKKCGLSNNEFTEDINYLAGGKNELDDHSEFTWFDAFCAYMLLGLIWPISLAKSKELMNERLAYIESRRHSKESG